MLSSFTRLIVSAARTFVETAGPARRVADANEHSFFFFDLD